MNLFNKVFPKGRRFLYLEYPGVWVWNLYYKLRGSPYRKTIWKWVENPDTGSMYCSIDFIQRNILDDLLSKLKKSSVCCQYWSISEIEKKCEEVLEDSRR